MSPTQPVVRRPKRWSAAIGALLGVAALTSCAVPLDGQPFGTPSPSSTAAAATPEATSTAPSTTTGIDFDIPPGWDEAESKDLGLPPNARVERRLVGAPVAGFEPNITVISEEKQARPDLADYTEGYQTGVIGQPGQAVVDDIADTEGFDGVEGLGFTTGGPVPGSNDLKFAQHHAVLERDGRIYYVAVTDVRGSDRVKDTMDGIRTSWKWN